MAAAGRSGVPRRRDALLAAAFGLAAFATRWPRRGHTLYSWDSGLLASGILEYDFASGHPHPPYYPLAIALGKVVAPWTGPVEALVLLSVLASAVMAATTYLVARALVGPWAAAFAATLVVLSPTALFNGVVALTYALEGASSAVVAWAAWRCREAPTPRRTVILAVATSVAIGIRPSSLFLVAPLAVWAVWGRWRAMAVGVGAGAAATAAWAVPAIVAGGGLHWFLVGNRYQSRFAVFAHTVVQEGWDVVPANAARLASYAPTELPFFAALLVVVLVTGFLAWPNRPPPPGMAFLAAWILPSLAFFLLVYDGWPVYPTGYVLVLVPAFAVAAAVAATSVVRGLLASGAPAFARNAALLGVGLLLAMPAAWAATWDEATEGQREADAWSESWWALEQEYPANDTALLTYYAWFWCRIEHPDYLTWGILPYWNATGEVFVQVVQGQGDEEDRGLYSGALDGDDEDPHPIPAHIKRAVIIHGPPSRGETDLLKPGVPREDKVLGSGLRVTVVDLAGLDTIEQAIRWYDDEGRILVE
jgi:hypothetical protein